MQDEIPGTIRAHYQQLLANAADCTKCRGCEGRCPFHVPVAERMEKTKALFFERIGDKKQDLDDL